MVYGWLTIIKLCIAGGGEDVRIQVLLSHLTRCPRS